MYYPVCGIVHIKDPLLLIEKSGPSSGGSEWVGTTSQSSVQTNPGMLDGVEIWTVICHKKIYSVSSCMKGGIIMLKNRDVGVVMEQRNDAMSNNVTK